MHRGASARRERQTSFKIVTWTKQTWTKHHNTDTKSGEWMITVFSQFWRILKCSQRDVECAEFSSGELGLMWIEGNLCSGTNWGELGLIWIVGNLCSGSNWCELGDIGDRCAGTSWEELGLVSSWWKGRWAWCLLSVVIPATGSFDRKVYKVKKFEWSKSELTQF